MTWAASLFKRHKQLKEGGSCEISVLDLEYISHAKGGDVPVPLEEALS